MANGYAGKILKVDLTTHTVEEIPTEKYQKWGGGHGMGSAVFWDLCVDKTVKGTDPANVVTIMTSPLTGTLAPSVSGRCEVQGIGLQGYPTPWFTRSNFGGRFSSMLKYAGYDGLAIVGRSETPVWLNIVNDKIVFEDATTLWGLDTRETQEEIWATVTKGREAGAWGEVNGTRDGGRSTQRPAVLTIGPNAEKYGVLASLIHDAGNGAGQGGFGGVFASKNLKAVSVLGTGGVDIADPEALLSARLWAQQYAYAGHADDPNKYVGMQGMSAPPGNAIRMYSDGVKSRPQACVACLRSCRGRTSTGWGNESSCIDFHWFTPQDKQAHGGLITENTAQATDILQRYGMNASTFMAITLWFQDLLAMDILGKGKEINTELPVEKFGSVDFAKALIEAIAENRDIGADLAQGLPQAAKKWGRYDQDTKSGLLPIQEWGYAHHYDARTEFEWGLGSILGERDINGHDFDFPLYWTPTLCAMQGKEPEVSAQRVSEIFAKKTVPFNDPMMIDYSDTGIYEEGVLKATAWLLWYGRFWKNSILYCDWAWADLVNPYGPDHEGMTPEGEPKFLNAVTGGELTFEQGMRTGQKIWNLDRAIWVLQGRHRDQEVFTDYSYDVPSFTATSGSKMNSFELPYVLPVHENGQWSFKSVAGRKLDRAKVEETKTKYYEFEGWDPTSGWPTRESLEKLDLGNVADELEKAGKLGVAK